MRNAYYFLKGLPSQCSHMSFEELLFIAALVTLLVAVVLMISGREVA